MITLYANKSGNSHRASIMLEEVGLPYEARLIDFDRHEQESAAFRAINPTGQVPAILDPEGPDGRPLLLGEGLAIALYLAEKTGKLIPTTVRARAEAMRWSAVLIAGIQGSIQGIFYARMLGEAEHIKVIDNHFVQIDRFLKAMDGRLDESAYLAEASYSYADVMCGPLVFSTLVRFQYDLTPYPAILRWKQRLAERPAVQRGLAALS